MEDQMFELPLVAEGQDTLSTLTVSKSNILGLFRSKHDAEKRCVVAITSSTKFSVAQSYETLKALLYGVVATSDTTYKEGKVYYNDVNGTVITTIAGNPVKLYAPTGRNQFDSIHQFFSPPGKLLVNGTDYNVGDLIASFGKVVYEQTTSVPYESTVTSIPEAK